MQTLTLRERARRFVEHPRVKGLIIALILVNAVLLGLETWPAAMAAYGSFFIPFILVATFTVLNLFIAIVVNAMESCSEAEHQETIQALE